MRALLATMSIIAALPLTLTIASAQQARTVVAQATTSTQPARTNSIGSLSAQGYRAINSVPHPKDPNQAILVLQNASEVQLCPFWIDKLGVQAGQCAKAQ